MKVELTAKVYEAIERVLDHLVYEERHHCCECALSEGWAGDGDTPPKSYCPDHVYWQLILLDDWISQTPMTYDHLLEPDSA